MSSSDLPGLVAELAGVSADVGRTAVLRGVDLTVAAGEVVGVTGANGSGKSTLLRVVATLLEPVAGTVRVSTADGGIALVGHAPALYPRLTLRENLTFVARLTGREEKLAVDALAAVGLAGAADRRADRCSQGMQRRAELARAFFTAPSLLLLDEVHTGLDQASVGLVEHLVATVRSGGGGSVIVSHETDRLNALADRVVELTGGRLVPHPAEVAA